MPKTVLPILHIVSLKSLRPTQMTVGMREVVEAQGIAEDDDR